LLELREKQRKIVADIRSRLAIEEKNLQMFETATKDLPKS
jgi:hypothetical protein